MDEQQHTPAPNPEHPHGESKGPAIGILIIIILIILGGLYFWGQRSAPATDTQYPSAMNEEDTPQDQAPDPFEEVNESDEIEAIEEDLEEDFSSIDSELEGLDAEFENI